MPLKRLLEHFVDSISWAFKLDYSGLSMDKHKTDDLGINIIKIITKDT